MNDLRKYSREFLVEFIDLYKSLPAVWKIKSKEYCNRDMKTQAYDILVRKFKEVEPSADRDFVTKKINNMRSVYRRELKKINTEYSGMGTDEVPSPSLWYFHLLDFLRDQEMPRPSMSSMDEESTQVNRELNSEQVSSPAPHFVPSPAHSPMNPPSPANSASSSTSSASRRPKKRPLNMTDGILNKISNQLDLPVQQLDRFDYMAKSWSETLRILSNEQRIIAEKIINDVFFEAQLNTLTRESRLQVENRSNLVTTQFIPGHYSTQNFELQSPVQRRQYEESQSILNTGITVLDNIQLQAPTAGRLTEESQSILNTQVINTQSQSQPVDQSTKASCYFRNYQP